MFSAELGMVVSRPCRFLLSLIGSRLGECACGPLGFRGGGRRETRLGIIVEALGGFYFGAWLVPVQEAPVGRQLLDRHSSGVLNFILGGPGLGGCPRTPHIPFNWS